MSVYRKTKTVCVYRNLEIEGVCVCRERERERERETEMQWPSWGVCLPSRFLSHTPKFF